MSMADDEFKERLIYFYNNYEEKSPIKVLLLMLVSLGFYTITWVYFTNRVFEKLDENAPDSKRGVILLLFFPLFLFLIMFILKTIIFSETNNYLYAIEIIGWGCIIFLSLNYIYDFCVSFGMITKSRGVYWYFLLYVEYLGLVLAAFGFFYTTFLILLTIITIPFMQWYLNYKSKEICIKDSMSYYNRIEKIH